MIIYLSETLNALIAAILGHKSSYALVETDVERIPMCFVCVFFMLAVIVNNEIAKSKRLGIEIQLNIEKINLDFISPIDMTTIFSNLLDNAIEACAEVTEERSIRFSIVQQMNFITVNIRNPYSRINQHVDIFKLRACIHRRFKRV